MKIQLNTFLISCKKKIRIQNILNASQRNNEAEKDYKATLTINSVLL